MSADIIPISRFSCPDGAVQVALARRRLARAVPILQRQGYDEYIRELEKIRGGQS